MPLSGVIVDHLDLQWLFWIDLIALPAAFAAQRVIPPSPPVKHARVDWIGAALLEEAALPTEGAYTAALASAGAAGVLALPASRLVPRSAERVSLEPARAGSP